MEQLNHLLPSYLYKLIHLYLLITTRSNAQGIHLVYNKDAPIKEIGLVPPHKIK